MIISIKILIIITMIIKNIKNTKIRTIVIILFKTLTLIIIIKKNKN